MHRITPLVNMGAIETSLFSPEGIPDYDYSGDMLFSIFVDFNTIAIDALLPIETRKAIVEIMVDHMFLTGHIDIRIIYYRVYEMLGIQLTPIMSSMEKTLLNLFNQFGEDGDYGMKYLLGWDQNRLIFVGES